MIRGAQDDEGAARAAKGVHRSIPVTGDEAGPWFETGTVFIISSGRRAKPGRCRGKGQRCPGGGLGQDVFRYAHVGRPPGENGASHRRDEGVQRPVGAQSQLGAGRDGAEKGLLVEMLLCAGGELGRFHLPRDGDDGRPVEAGFG